MLSVWERCGAVQCGGVLCLGAVRCGGGAAVSFCWEEGGGVCDGMGWDGMGWDVYLVRQLLWTDGRTDGVGDVMGWDGMWVLTRDISS